MPRSRRRHHSRSRSRSRSHSHDRERNVKRRKIDNCEDLHSNSRRSVSSEPEANANDGRAQNTTVTQSTTPPTSPAVQQTAAAAAFECETHDGDDDANCMDTSCVSTSSAISQADVDEPSNKSAKAAAAKKLNLTPRQVEKRMLQDRKNEARRREKEERRRQKEEERTEKQRKRTQEKEAKEAKLREEREAKEKERELKRQERVVKDEVKRKEREEREVERQKKLAGMEEKNREKQKAVELKQKAAMAFSKFFTKTNEGGGAAIANAANKKCEDVAHGITFMPFQIKSDMRLPPQRRTRMSSEDKHRLEDVICGRITQNEAERMMYTKQIKIRGMVRRCAATWMLDEDADGGVSIVDENLGETITPIALSKKMKAKFLKFSENQRPAYYGTWRKRSAHVSGRRPLARDAVLDYDVDSDDEWEQEAEEGEDIAGSDDDEKEPDADYEVDNDFFVPHGHLSDDEGDDAGVTAEDDKENMRSVETRKAMEKLLNNQFEEERKLQTQKLKPRVLGCVWIEPNREVDDVESSIRSFLQPYSIICAGAVRIEQRSQLLPAVKNEWQLDKQHMPDLLRMLHGNPHKVRQLVVEFDAYVTRKSPNVVINKSGLAKLIRSIAKWKRRGAGERVNDGSKKSGAWLVNAHVQDAYGVHLTLPNQWSYVTASLS